MPTRSPHAEDDPESDIELDEDTASDPHPRHVSNYLAHLHEHAQSVRQHVTGAPTDYYLTSQPSYFAPNAYWTAQEKDAFFHALSVHSRLRPDLIAEEIGTKSLADVCAYMDMLEDGMKRNPSSSNDDATADARGLVFASRDDFPIAYEVSEKWTDFEDELAEALMADEPDMIAEGLQRARDDLIREERLGIRARKGDARLADNTRDREGEKMRKQRFQQWLQGQEAEWQKEDLLNRMDGSLMKAMDMVIREHEEARALLPEVDAKPYEPEDQHMSPEVPSGDVPAGHALTTDTIPPLDEEFIDPSLRSSAAPTAVHSPESSNSRTGRPHTPEPTNPHDTFNPVTPPFADVHKAASSSTLFEPHADTASVADSNAAAGAELERPLSPASRRRLRKRMYMRRKRAEATGGDVDQSLGRLKPGRKPLPRPGEVEDDTVPTRHAHPSGKTLTYKMKEQLKVAEITPEWLEEEHLDLFHMSGLYKLMRTYNQLHDVPDDVLSEISIQTLRTLRNEVVRFIFRVVQRAIISREQEMISKIHTKVWRLGDNQVINTANVTHALALIGQENCTKAAHFQNLLPRLHLAEDDFGDEEDGEEATSSAPRKAARGKQKAKAKAGAASKNAESEDAPAAAAHPILQSAPLNRVVFPPFVRLPGTAARADKEQSLLSYIPWATRLDAPDAPDASGDEADEEREEREEREAEALVKELQEEEQLDVADCVDEKKYEAGLWAEFERARKREGGEGYAERARKRRKVIKTAPFVESSDEE